METWGPLAQVGRTDTGGAKVPLTRNPEDYRLGPNQPSGPLSQERKPQKVVMRATSISPMAWDTESFPE